MCERGGVRGPFRVADKAGVGDVRRQLYVV